MRKVEFNLYIREISDMALVAILLVLMVFLDRHEISAGTLMRTTPWTRGKQVWCSLP